MKQKIDLTPKEEAEVRDVGVILCPETLKEFYEHLREAERKVERETETEDLDYLRKNNVLLEGKRLKMQKWVQ